MNIKPSNWPRLPGSPRTSPLSDFVDGAYEEGVWGALRYQLDPMDASNIQDRNFGTIYLKGKPMIVEWLDQYDHRYYEEEVKPHEGYG